MLYPTLTSTVIQKAHLKQVEANLLVVARTVGALHHGNNHRACSAAVRLLGHRELILRVVPEIR